MGNIQNKNSWNKSLISIIIAAICIVIYLGALVQATVRFYLSVDKNRILAEQEFSQIAGIALSAGNTGFMDQRYIDTIERALASSKSIEALIITGPDGDFAFEKKRGHAVAWVNNSPRFINRFSFSNQSHYMPLPIKDVRNANIKAVAGAFDNNEFIKILKETLLIILIGFAVAFLTFLTQVLLGKQYAGYSSNLENHFSEENDIPFPEVGPKGLYSPRSNIGWEEYTKDRLDAELHRCSSSEKDLAFVLIEFTDLTNDIMFKESAEEAVCAYSSRDLVFEHGRWGIAVIIPGINLETAISKSEKFFKAIMDKFPRGYNSESNIYIGITSRSGRLLNAGRLMLEAREAVKKAKAEKSPIIGFKSDPEKYRDFLNK